MHFNVCLSHEHDKRGLRKRAAFFSAEDGHLCYVHVGGDLNSARGWSLKMQVSIVNPVLEEAHLERYKSLAQTYYWPELYNQVRSYVNSNRAQTQG